MLSGWPLIADGPLGESPAVVHYYDSTGRDFGWHREPNLHVDGLEHYQERDSPEAAYEYDATRVDSHCPVELLGDILGHIEQRVADEF